MDLEQPAVDPTPPTDPPKEKQRRKRYCKTEKESQNVAMWSGFGVCHATICLKLKITAKTLYRHYRLELDEGKAQGEILAVGMLFKAMQAGEQWAIALYLGQKCGWWPSMKQQRQLLGADGQPINPPASGVTYVIKTEELKQITQQLQDIV